MTIEARLRPDAGAVHARPGLRAAHQRATLVVFVCTVALTVVLYVVIPKGFFPQQDTGIIVGLSDAPQDISFAEMVRRQHLLTDIVARDPDVAELRRRRRRRRPVNNGFRDPSA